MAPMHGNMSGECSKGPASCWSCYEICQNNMAVEWALKVVTCRKVVVDGIVGGGSGRGSDAH